VKHLRVLLLVLLTVLLPVRGAVAAAMLCSGGGVMAAAASAAPAPMVVGHCDQARLAAFDMATHGAGSPDSSSAPTEAADDDASSSPHAGACPFCAGGCNLTPMAVAPPSVEAVAPASTAHFPELTTPVAARYPDSQERPPRTP